MTLRIPLWRLALCLGAGCLAAQVAAQGVAAVTFYSGRGADLNLKEVPGSLLSRDIPWEKSWFNGLGVSGDWGRLGQVFSGAAASWLAQVRHGYEVLLLQHHGRQVNQEVGAAYTLKTPATVLGPVRVAAVGGLGLSYALGTPTYEDGPFDDPARRYRLQQLMLFGLEWRPRGGGAWALETRVHHRSGVYGMVAPRNVGSNFFALALRYAF